MSDPNAMTGTHSPGVADLHLSTAGWVTTPGAEEVARVPGAPHAVPNDATHAFPDASTPGPQAPERVTDSDSTEPLEEPVVKPRPKPSGVPRLPPIPGYAVLAYVGRGGMGVVYRARHQRLDRLVALKIINPSGSEDDIARERFDREVKVLAALKHPNIVPVYDAGEWHGFPYCAMEFAEGGTLSAQLDRVRADRPAAVRLMVKVARAVAAMHAAGVLHRDLKPLNILLGASDEPMVADFGLARNMGDESDLTYTGFPVGTRQYMAPEQTQGRRTDYTASCDVWALGVTLYEVLTGDRPFCDDGVTDVYHRIRFDDPTPCERIAPGVPAELEAIARRCLAKRPEDRYPTATALADDLENWLGGRPVTAPPVPVPTPAPVVAPILTTPTAEADPTPARHSRLKWVVLAVATAVMFACFTLGLSGALDKKPAPDDPAPKAPATRVAEGETVLLTNAKGVPTGVWEQTPGHTVTSFFEQGYHKFSTTGIGVVPLVDDQWQGPIRVEADLAVYYTTAPAGADAGVYVGRRSWANPNISNESLMWFGVGARWVDKNAKGKELELARLKGMYWWHGNNPGEKNTDKDVRRPWSADGKVGDAPQFVRVVIEVRANEITGTVDGVNFGPWTSKTVLAALELHRTADHPKLPLSEFKGPAFGTGIGIYLRSATCTVVNLSVSKLTPCPQSQ